MFLRYLFAWSIPDAYDFCRLLLGILIFWGMAVASYRGDHITVDLFWTAVRAIRAARHGCVFRGGHARRHVRLHLDVRRKVIGTRADHVGTFDMRQPVWVYYLIAWIGLAAAVLLLVARTVAAGILAGKAGAWRRAGNRLRRCMSTDAVAVIGFVALFALMLLRVPVGIAMGTGRRAGFGYMIGDIGPALKLLSDSPRSAPSPTYEFGVIPLFLLMGAFASASGMSRELFRAANTFRRSPARRARHRHHRRLRRLRGDLRIVGRNRRHFLRRSLSGDAATTAIRRASPPA